MNHVYGKTCGCLDLPKNQLTKIRFSLCMYNSLLSANPWSIRRRCSIYYHFSFELTTLVLGNMK